jgi:competence protein ComGC
MFETIIQKITQLSQLPQFSGGTVEHGLFSVIVIAIAICITLLIILVVRVIVKGLVEIWKLGCEVRKKSLDTKVQIEQERTKTSQAGRRLSSS